MQEDRSSTEGAMKKGRKKMGLVLAAGASDAAEGLVPLDERRAVPAAEKDAGAGFWSIAPGCNDVSEGMVWVSVKKG